MTDNAHPERYRSALRILSALLLLLFLGGLAVVLSPFLIPLLWSSVLVTATWPALRWIQARFPKPRYLAPALLTLLLGVILILTFIPLPLRLASELREIGVRLEGVALNDLERTLTTIPLVGTWLSRFVSSVVTTPSDIAPLLEEHRSTLLALATSAARGILSTVVTVFATLVGCYVLYRHGESLVNQLRRVLGRIGGSTTPQLLDTVHSTVRGAAYSVVATALAQGVLAGIGYVVADAPTPLLLALITTAFSIIPFGTPVVYMPVCLYLLFMSGLPWFHGIGLFVWCTLVVSTVDNLLRPLFISQSTQLSPVLVFMGVLGGVAAFGLLGVFIGPAIIAVAQWLWLDLVRGAES